jgi:ATP-dependent helicase/nuclease subunit A
MMTLTKDQKKAVHAAGKNILVSAGAGTGKTRVLVERILHILRTQKATITELLVLTFTEKAANEIKTRLSDSFRELNLERPRRDLEKAAISTFHSFASRLLKEHPIEAGVDPDFRVIETEQSELLKEEVMNETIAKLYEEKDEAFELLSVYGEDAARAGILKVFTAARHEGKNLRDFFTGNKIKEQEICAKREAELPGEAQALIAKLEEIDAGAWERFLNNREWGWKTFGAFREWCGLYKGKRKAGWKEWRALLEDLAALRIGPLGASWNEKFESMALAFEAAYSAKKKEKGFLDFDDLQMKAVGLFRSRKPALQKLRERCQRGFQFILVDESQDTNFLQMEFVELFSSGNNLFMVGDYKQSIYGFRGAEPAIFLGKEKLYENGAAGERIFLAESFRSDPPVLDFVNRFFKTLWEEDCFPFEPLIASVPERPGLNGKNPVLKGSMENSAVEVLVTEMKEGEDMRYARLREARVIAARVRELHEKEKIPYGDIAVLFQAMTLSGIYEDAFKSAGVPYFIVAGRGFYEQPEIQDMMSYLSHLERSLEDIPLAATLRSPLFHITDDTLFWLSRHAKEKSDEVPLIRALIDLEQLKEILPEQKARLEEFLKLTRELRKLKDRIPLSELIDRILEGTGYELSVLMDPKGVRRYANLKKLIAMVREYETYERMPLGAFLNILKRLRAQEVRESEAQITLETGAEAVRMMSVHAAKGLEFPVVFVADMGHQGSRSDSRSVIAHAADGYAMQVRDPTNLEMQRPYFFRWVDQAIARREDEEWKRLFYVAATRAKSRLFLSGVHKKKKEEKKTFREMACWMDWAMAICEGLQAKMSYDKECPAELRGGTREDFRKKMETAIQNIKWKEKPLSGNGKKGSGPSFPRSIDLPVSAYVLFQKDPKEFWRTYQIGWSMGENEWAPEDAVFEEEDFSAADFGTVLVQDSLEGLTRTAPIFTARKLMSIGTVMHGFFEHLDLERPEYSLEPEILDRVFGRFGKEAVDDARKIIQDFLKQPVFQQLRKARQVKREIDFALNERRGLIHGKIDILFEDEKGDWHILDYKTAAGDEATVRKSAYDLQLEIYTLAAGRILKLPVRSAIIYYLKNQKAVTLSFPVGKSKALFDDLEKKICDLQQRILDYSNEQMVAEHRLRDEV